MRHGGAGQRGAAIAAGECDRRGRLEAQGRPGKLHLQRRGAGRVADQEIGQAKGQRIHRAGGRDADPPEADAAGIVLHRRLQPGLQHASAVAHDAGPVGAPSGAAQAR